MYFIWFCLKSFHTRRIFSSFIISTRFSWFCIWVPIQLLNAFSSVSFDVWEGRFLFFSINNFTSSNFLYQSSSFVKTYFIWFCLNSSHISRIFLSVIFAEHFLLFCIWLDNQIPNLFSFSSSAFSNGRRLFTLINSASIPSFSIQDTSLNSFTPIKYVLIDSISFISKSFWIFEFLNFI